MRIGKGEQEIIEFLKAAGGSPLFCVEIIAAFAPYTKKAGDRNSYSQYSVVRRRLFKMQEKGLVRIENYGRTDCKVHLEHEK